MCKFTGTFSAKGEDVSIGDDGEISIGITRPNLHIVISKISSDIYRYVETGRGIGDNEPFTFEGVGSIIGDQLIFSIQGGNNNEIGYVKSCGCKELLIAKFHTNGTPGTERFKAKRI